MSNLETNVIIQGDALEVLQTIPDNSIDSVVTDPPYGIAFMGKTWDSFKSNAQYAEWCEQWARECLRVLKPGGHLLAFGGTRTYHALAWGIEQAGFEIRDMIEWLYTSGFPKSMDISKQFDKRKGFSMGGFDLKELGEFIRTHREKAGLSRLDASEIVTGRRTGAFWNWETGYCLPQPELWPKIKKTIKAPDSKWDEMFERAEREKIGEKRGAQSQSTGRYGAWGNDNGTGRSVYAITLPETPLAKKWAGWGTALKPAHEPIVMARKPLEKNVCYTVKKYGTGAINIDDCRQGENRFPANCITLDEDAWYSKYFNVTPRELSKKANKKDRGEHNTHPTVKPTALMAWLIRLVTPPGGIVLDPFAGSGSTLVAAKREGFQYIGIELEPKYIEIAERRLLEVDGDVA